MIAYHADVALEGALHLLRHVVVTRKSLLQKFGPDLDQNESKAKLRRVDKKILVLYENTPTPTNLSKSLEMTLVCPETLVPSGSPPDIRMVLHSSFLS